MYLTVEQGIEKLLSIYDAHKQKPIVVAVHSPTVEHSKYCSPADHGKTYFSKKSVQAMESSGFRADFTDGFERPAHLLEQPLSVYDYLVLHMVTPNADIGAGNRLSQELLGRDVNVNVLIFNHNLLRKGVEDISSKFDVVVENPDSTRKERDIEVKPKTRINGRKFYYYR